MKILGMGVPELLILAIIVAATVIAAWCGKRYQEELDAEEACRTAPESMPESEGECIGRETLQTAAQTASESMPAIESWKPAPVFSVLGVLANATAFPFVLWMLSIPVAFVGGSAGLSVSLLIWSGISIAYALVVYPSYFTKKPLIKSSHAISFLNYAIGWIIFGALWNDNILCSNLEKRPKKGYSHIVFVVLEFLFLLYLYA